MCLSAVVESQMYITQTLNHDALNKVANDLLQMYKDHSFTHESIQQVLAKLLSNVPTNAGAKILDRIAVEIIQDLKSFIYKHSDNLSLFLILRKCYLQRYQG
jgi:hypothetical protein